MAVEHEDGRAGATDRLACGRDAARVWEHAEAGTLDEHERTCPHCRSTVEDRERLAGLVGFAPPSEKDFIKRVIGIPGDTVEIDDGKVIVNGTALDEPYVPEEYRDHVNLSPRKIRNGYYFVLGDHRSSSSDSRMWGFVDRPSIYGKAVFVYWPLDKIGRVR